MRYFFISLAMLYLFFSFCLALALFPSKDRNAHNLSLWNKAVFFCSRTSTRKAFEKNLETSRNSRKAFGHARKNGKFLYCLEEVQKKKKERGRWHLTCVRPELWVWWGSAAPWPGWRRTLTSRWSRRRWSCRTLCAARSGWGWSCRVGVYRAHAAVLVCHPWATLNSSPFRRESVKWPLCEKAGVCHM